MAVKRGRIITVDGCPCEVVEENVERGVAYGNEYTAPRRCGPPRPLVVAPDGSLVMPNPYLLEAVSSVQPKGYAAVLNLRRLAREMNA